MLLTNKFIKPIEIHGHQRPYLIFQKQRQQIKTGKGRNWVIPLSPMNVGVHVHVSHNVAMFPVTDNLAIDDINANMRILEFLFGSYHITSKPNTEAIAQALKT